MKPILVATSNPGKIRDFAAAASSYGIEIAAVPNFSSLPPVIEDGATFGANARKKAEGMIIDEPRGTNGFGYDPLFYFPAIGKTFAELPAEEKAKYSHRGEAFRAFLDWYQAHT